jgi:thiamine biosynthesis lipoprotein
LDPGGIGKGYAVDRMVAILKAENIQSALISAGSSSIYALGSPPGKKGWEISIRHPRDLAREAQQVELKDMSLSTSGTSEKFSGRKGASTATSWIRGPVIQPMACFPFP